VEERDFMKLEYATGFYSISFFNINIGTKEELTQDVLKKEEATFTHEFIHYLQDLILPYNIRYNLSNVRRFLNILEYAHQHRKIIRPFDEWTVESRTLCTQFIRSFGGITQNESDRFIDQVVEIGNVISDFEITSGFDSNLNVQREHRVYKYSLPVLAVGATTPIHYNLGARDLLEYIAYKIELKNFPNRSLAPQLPYESVDLIFNKYGLSHIADDIRLCIAECCLYNDNPIHFLFNILLGNEKFKEFISKSSYEEIYKYLLYSETVTRDGYRESLANKTQRRLKQFANELYMQYNGFDEIRKWILKVNNFVEGKLNERFIFSDLYKMDNNELHKFINDVIHQIGVPLVMNSKEKYISIQSNKIETSQFIQFYILQNFINFVQVKETECPIYDFCKENWGICNDNCTLNNQNSIKGNRNCNYRKFLETYELLDIEFN
jgi:hypothetical protein